MAPRYTSPQVFFVPLKKEQFAFQSRKGKEKKNSGVEPIKLRKKTIEATSKELIYINRRTVNVGIVVGATCALRDEHRVFLKGNYL